ncbi:hypothetical protein [Nocardia sp. NPDC052566]|uniref:hypothetical protein n=1 Tax=Nocardia sp. NPDC052566 TaxID=3364330 RepID=UPI0037C6B200
MLTHTVDSFASENLGCHRIGGVLMKSRRLLTDPGDYEAIRNRMASFFYLDRRFPEDVYRLSGVRTVFIEYEVGISSGFWLALSRLAEMFGDTSVDFLVVDPAHGSVNIPASWDVYPAFSIDVTSSTDDFADAITEPTPDAEGIWMVGDLSNVVAITGRSGLWGCWGERNSGIMAIRAPDGDAFRVWREEVDLYLWGTYGILDIIAFNCRDWLVPHEFLDPFVENYRWMPGVRALDRMAFGLTGPPN